MKQGDPGLDTWASLDAAQHGGGQVWMPGSYDPETHLYIFGTGNPTPAYTANTRGREGATNLYTCSIVAAEGEHRTEGAAGRGKPTLQWPRSAPRPHERARSARPPPPSPAPWRRAGSWPRPS